MHKMAHVKQAPGTCFIEINNDDESVEDVARHLLELCLCDEHADYFFIAICGWNVDSLLRKIDML